MIVGITTSTVQVGRVTAGQPANDNGYGRKYGRSYGKA